MLPVLQRLGDAYGFKLYLVTACCIFVYVELRISADDTCCASQARTSSEIETTMTEQKRSGNQFKAGSGKATDGTACDRTRMVDQNQNQWPA